MPRIPGELPVRVVPGPSIMISEVKTDHIAFFLKEIAECKIGEPVAPIEGHSWQGWCWNDEIEFGNYSTVRLEFYVRNGAPVSEIVELIERMERRDPDVWKLVRGIYSTSPISVVRNAEEPSLFGVRPVPCPPVPMRALYEIMSVFGFPHTKEGITTGLNIYAIEKAAGSRAAIVRAAALAEAAAARFEYNASAAVSGARAALAELTEERKEA